jgi:hypothetical protein
MVAAQRQDSAQGGSTSPSIDHLPSTLSGLWTVAPRVRARALIWGARERQGNRAGEGRRGRVSSHAKTSPSGFFFSSAAADRRGSIPDSISLISPEHGSGIKRDFVFRSSADVGNCPASPA